MRLHLWIAACCLVWACGDDDGVQATDAAVQSIDPDRVLPAIAPSSNKLVVGPGIGDAVPTCAADELACNGVCISARTPASADASGCRLIDGAFSKVDVFAEGNALYAGGERKPNAEQGVYRIGLGGEANTLLAKLDEARVIGLHDGKLIVLAEGGCDGPGPLTKCLKTVPTSGGEPTALFAGLNDSTPAIAGGKAFYVDPYATGLASVYERALFDGAPVARFAGNPSGLGDLEFNGTYAYFSRLAGNAQLLTRLGVPGTTVQLTADPADSLIEQFFAGEYLYMLRRFEADGAHYQRLKLGADTGEALAELPLVPIRVVVSGDSIFFGALSNVVDRIYRMPLQGDTITPVATFAHSAAQSWVVIGKSLYVVVLGSGSSIVRIALP